MPSGHVQSSRSQVEDGGNSTNKPEIVIVLASLPSRLIAVLLGAMFALVAVDMRGFRGLLACLARASQRI